MVALSSNMWFQTTPGGATAVATESTTCHQVPVTASEAPIVRVGSPTSTTSRAATGPIVVGWADTVTETLSPGPRVTGSIWSVVKIPAGSSATATPRIETGAEPWFAMTTVKVVVVPT